VVGERPQPEFVDPALAGADRVKAELRTAPPTSSKKGWAANKSRAGKAAPPRFSKVWPKGQLGRLWVLFPVCGLICASAIWLTIRINSGENAVSHVHTASPLNKPDRTVAPKLEREKPKLSQALVAKPGAAIDEETQLPVRVLAAKFTTDEPLELALVKPGTYNFGAPIKERRSGEISQRAVRIERPFYIAIHETTNAQYQRFYEAQGPAQAGDRWQRAAGKWAAPLQLDPLKNSLPVTNVSPQQAQAFCAWVGGRLSTEIEWESAVRGPQDRGDPYPWGSAPPTRERCRIFYGDDLGAGLGGPLPVDELLAGASPLGLMHALGNAAEWCQNSEQPGDFILRGCSIGTANIHDIRVTWRAAGNPRGDEDTGFRVLIPALESASDGPPPLKSDNVPRVL
jgi:formylglycine-generating enzyme required for sulfatase activity